MDAAQSPRHFTPGTDVPGAGLPTPRDERIAARRAFVELKQSFLQALDQAGGAPWLCRQVRGAEEPVDLWLLRAPVFEALAGSGAVQREQRQRLRRGLDSLFPDLDTPSRFTQF